MLLRSVLNTSFFLALLLVSVLVIVTADSVAAERPESSITNILDDWITDDDDDVTVEWAANAPPDKEIDKIYFWACYYDNEGECKETSINEWELIETHLTTSGEKDAGSGTKTIRMDKFSSKFDNKEGRYRLITCAVNEDGIAEYGKEESTNDDGCHTYRTASHSTYFDSAEMKEFGFDQTAPEVLTFEIDRYNNVNGSTKILSYEVEDDVSKLSIISIEYSFNSSAYWSLEDEDISGMRTYGPNSIDFEYDQHNNCVGCGQGDYKFKLRLTDIAGNVRNKIVTSTLDFSEPELKNYEATGPHVNDWLDVDDEITLEWEGDDDISGIESVKIEYCLWENIESVNPTKSPWPEAFENENILILTVTNNTTEGLYYFFPVMIDYAGNPSESVSCQGHDGDRFMLDKTPPTASLGPGESGTFAYNETTSISIFVSDNVELGSTSLRYAYSDEFNYGLADSSFSGQTVIYATENLSGNITHNALLEPFNFPYGQGTYRFFLETDDLHPVTPTTEIKMTLIYDTQAPESNIVFDGEGTGITNQEKYTVYCSATDPNHRVESLYLYHRYSEDNQSYSNWSEGDDIREIPYAEPCEIDFEPPEDGFYQFYLIAEDEAGNKEWSPQNDELTLLYDSTKPDFELMGFVNLDSKAEGFMALDHRTVYYNSNEIGEGEYHVKFIGSATDFLSGVNGSLGGSGANLSSWTLDGSVWSIDYYFNRTIIEEGDGINLELHDHAGNLAQLEINFESDTNSPTFSLYNTALENSIDGGETLLVKSEHTEILLLVSGGGSPILSYETRSEGDEWTPLIAESASFSIPNGVDTISLRVTDAVGNSIIRTFSVEHDNEEPEFNPLEFDGANYHVKGDVTYLNRSVDIQLSASDASSGLEIVEYRYEEEEWKNYVPEDRLPISGHTNFSYRATDRLGNVAEKQIRFVIDNRTPEIDSNMINITLVSNSGNASNDIYWNGSQTIDYNEFSSLFLNLENVSDDEGGSGIGKTLIRYSSDNSSWLEYDNSTGIELSSSSIYIRVTASDNVGNSAEEYNVVVEVINVPVEEEPESRSMWSVLAILLVMAAAGSVGVYKYRQTQITAEEGEEAPGLEQEAVEPEPASINCPNCNVMISTESKSCNFCGCSWDDLGNVVLGAPLATMGKQVGKEIVPRTGEILIGDGLERWKMDVGAKTSVGGRKNNEDSISWNQLIKSTNDTSQSVRLGIVADGVGGRNKGEIASSVAISAINDTISKSLNDPFRTNVFSPKEHLEILKKAYHNCNNAVYKLARKGEYSGMATTAVSVYLWEEEKGSAGFLIGNVGDSRGYLININEIKQVTKDDSEVQKLVDSGEITEREARTHSRKNVITQAIGNKKKITPRTTTHLLENLEYDTVLICSDGVSDRLSNAEIHKIVKKYDNPQDVCDRIAKVINRTNTNHDNISVICIKFPNLLVGD